MHPDLIYRALSASLRQKKALLGETNTIRLLNAGASGTPGLVAELYDAHFIAYDYGIGLGQDFRVAASQWLREFGWESIVVLDRSQPGDEGRVNSAVAAGKVSDKIIVHEGPLRFWVEPQHPRNVGLFLDTRGLRSWLRENSAEKRVLNLFGYTCSLGLAALSGGATEVVNVDISDRYLKWGRENLKLNDLPESKCRFQCMDSERYLDWAAKKNLSFDQIILDPPVFSRFEGKVFRFESDYFRLVSKSLDLLSPSGILHAVTNFSGIDASDFKQRLEETAAATGKNIRDIRQLSLPPDFDVKPGMEREEGNAVMMQIGLDKIAGG